MSFEKVTVLALTLATVVVVSTALAEVSGAEPAEPPRIACQQ